MLLAYRCHTSLSLLIVIPRESDGLKIPCLALADRKDLRLYNTTFPLLKTYVRTMLPIPPSTGPLIQHATDRLCSAVSGSVSGSGCGSLQFFTGVCELSQLRLRDADVLMEGMFSS